MDQTRKYHPVLDNPVKKEYICYVLTDKLLIARKLRKPTIQLTNHMKLKKKEDHSVHVSVILREGKKTVIGGRARKRL